MGREVRSEVEWANDEFGGFPGQAGPGEGGRSHLLGAPVAARTQLPACDWSVPGDVSKAVCDDVGGIDHNKQPGWKTTN